ncbi:MAG: WG repeat-containing protein [Clostridia bacterium]|nr:WG repeat-containing protein [Clostridia bacterium]
MTKKFLLMMLVISFTMVLGFSFAEEVLKIYVDEEALSPTAVVETVDGSAFLPLCPTLEAMGFYVEASEEATYIGSRYDMTFRFEVANQAAIVNGEAVTLDLAPIQIDGTAHIPVEVISTLLNGKVIWDHQEDKLNIVTGQGQLFPVKKGNKFGFVNEKGDVVIDFNYQDASYFWGELGFVKKSSGKWNGINREGELVEPFDINYVLDGIGTRMPLTGRERTVAVNRDAEDGGMSRVGCYNPKGELVIPFDYTDISRFNNGIAIGTYAINYYGRPESEIKPPLETVLTDTGKIITSNRWSYYRPVYEPGNLFKISDLMGGGGFGYINLEGKVIVEPKYYSYGFQNGIADVGPSSNKKAPMDATGKFLTKFKYGDVNGLGEGAISYTYDCRKYGLMDYEGHEFLKPTYDYIQAFSEGLAQVGIGNEVGYINPQGQVVIPLIYEHNSQFNDFKDGVVKVMKDGKSGLINKAGEVIVPLIYHQYAPFKFDHGLAVVMLDYDRQGVINLYGKQIVPCEYDDITLRNGYIIAKKNQKFGCFDHLGNEIIPFIYDEMY